MFYKLKRAFIALLAKLTLLCTPLGLQAQVDPNIEWKEIETDSAYWIFDAKHQELAKHYVLQFEQAKQQVFPLFKEEPRKPTMVLLDNTDLANGSARVTPHPFVTLRMVKPSAHSSIGEFKNPVSELLVHEYTHILNMEPVHGWMSPAYWIFGSVAHPNMILPRWYTEGLAVYTESLISKDGGRLNSQYLQGLARALTLEDQWKKYPLSDLNDAHPDWLGSSRAYLFGGILWDSIARENGNETIYKFNQSYSRRIPYLLDGVIESHIGTDYEEQLARAYSYWQIRAGKQIEKISSKAQLDGVMIKHGSGSHYAPSISPDGLWMAFISSNLEGQGHISLTLRHPKNGFQGYKSKTILEKTQTQSINWHPAATGFVYEKIANYKRYYRYFDLYFYDLQSKKSHRITEGARAHHSCFSPTGDFIYFLENTAASKQVVSMNWQSKKRKVLYQAKAGDDLRYLNCPDSKSLLFIEHYAGQKPHIARYKIDSATKTIAFDKYPAKFLKLSRRGALLTSDVSGVENLYLLNKKNITQPQAITNTFTRVMQGELDPLDDSLYFSQLTASGPKIFHLKGAQWESLPDTPPQVDPILNFAKDKTNDTDKITQTSIKKETLKTSNFSPWRYLYPNHWIPFLYLIDGGTLYQAMTSAGDPLGINNISLVGQWDTLTKKAGGSASYLNNSLPVSLGVGVSDFYSYFHAFRRSLHFTSASALMSYNFEFLDYTRMTFKWNYSALESFKRQGPQIEFAYRKTKQNNNDISTSSGWKFQLGHKNYLADFGNVSYGETYAHLGTFWSSFTPKRHVFYLGINGNYAPRLNNVFFATSTLAGPFLNPQLTNTTFLQRGYPTGVFVGRNIVNTNAEYRFPIFNLYSGWTSPPVFLKNLQGAFVFDATSLDGNYSSRLAQSARLAEFGRWFTGYGLELESKINMGFHVPVSLTLGLYYGEEQESYGGFTTFFNIRL